MRFIHNRTIETVFQLLTQLVHRQGRTDAVDNDTARRRAARDAEELALHGAQGQFWIRRLVWSGHVQVHDVRETEKVRHPRQTVLSLLHETDRSKTEQRI